MNPYHAMALALLPSIGVLAVFLGFAIRALHRQLRDNRVVRSQLRDFRGAK